MLPIGTIDVLDLLQGLGELLPERDAAGLEADEHDVVEPVVVLDDLVSHAPHGPLHVLGVHHPFPGNKNAPVRGRQSTFSFSHCTSPVRTGLTEPASRSGVQVSSSPPVDPTASSPFGQGASGQVPPQHDVRALVGRTTSPVGTEGGVVVGVGDDPHS